MTQPVKQLERGDDAYRALFGAETATFVIAQGIEDCNDAGCRLLGRSREALLGRSPLDFAPLVQPDGTPSAEGARRRVESALAGLPQWFQWQFHRPEGEPVTTLVHVEAVRLDTTVRLLVQVFDLTQLRRAEASLRETETRLQQILDSASAIVFVKDEDGRYLFVNREYERSARAPRAQILGHTDHQLHAAEIAERLRQNDRRVLAERRSIEFEETIQSDGKTKTYLSVKFPLARGDGVPYAVCGIATDITDRKRSEHALQRAAFAVSSTGGEDLFRELARHLASILEVDAALIAVFVDRERSLMRTLAVYLDGRFLRNFEYDLTRTPCAGVVGQQFRFARSGVHGEFAPGTMFSALGFDSYTAYSLNDASGAQLGLIAAMDREALGDRDLTEAMLKIFAVRAAAEIERVRAQERLIASEASYRAIFEASEDAIFVHDQDTGAILDVSPKACELYGFSREEMRHISISDVSSNTYPYTREEALRLIQEARRGLPVRFEWHARNKRGDLMWHEVTLKQAAIAGRSRILAFTRDITQRKLADDALRASEEQYRAVFNAAADALVLRDADFRIVDVNPAYLAMSGYTREEVIGSNRVIVNLPEIYDRIRGLHRLALAGQPSVLETEGIRKDGTRFELDVRCVPTQYQGKPHVLFVGRDISRRKRAEAERLQLEAQLRQAQKMEAIGHLTGGIAHDFNNILTSVIGYMTLAAERDAALSDAKLAAYLEQAQLSCGRARDLIQQMLTFSRGQRGEPRPVNLGPLVQESVRLLRSSFPATLELATELEPDLPPVMLDPVQAEQVLLNLCINARDAMNAHGTVRVTARRALIKRGVCTSCRNPIVGEFSALEVADGGIGITAEVMDRMFEPFFTTKDVGKGSGMGLSMTHGIVHEHGGHIIVESQPGHGATFRILFPALEIDHVPAPAIAARRARAKPARVMLNGRVLVVDDEETVGRFMGELLESWGLQVTTKTSGVDARDAFRREPDRYDLVVTDQAMPRVTGLQLARDLLTMRPSVPVILYTGYADELTEAEARAAGIRALLRKPVEPRDLLALLRLHLPNLAEARR